MFICNLSHQTASLRWKMCQTHKVPSFSCGFLIRVSCWRTRLYLSPRYRHQLTSSGTASSHDANTTGPAHKNESKNTYFHLQLPVTRFLLVFTAPVFAWCRKQAGRSIWHYFRRCNTQWSWWLSIPIWTSNIVKRSKCSIHQTRLLQHSKESNGRRQQTDSRFKEEQTVGVVGEKLSRNTEDKHATWKPLYVLLCYIISLQDQKTKRDL